MELSLPLPRRGASRRGGSSRGAVAHSRKALDQLRANRLALRAAVALLLALPLLGGGWLWLRDSSFVAVRHVHITGVHGTEAIEIRSALNDAARRMSTLDFNAASLHTAVASFAIVGALRVKTELPHTVSISVTERPPVAVLQSAGQRTAVAADGTVLGPAWLSSSLPLVSGSVEPPTGGRLGEGFAQQAVTVLGAAPAALARYVARVYNGPEGLTVAMRNGLLAYFGDATRPHAKWLSLARVLVSPSAAGALYIDVRLPERPAAGFTAPSTSSSVAASSASSSGSSSSGLAGATSADPTAAALATRLSEAAGGEATPTTTTGARAAEETSSGSGSSTTGGTGKNEASGVSGSSGTGASESGGTGESGAISHPSETASTTGGEAVPEG